MEKNVNTQTWSVHIRGMIIRKTTEQKNAWENRYLMNVLSDPFQLDILHHGLWCGL